MTDRQPDVTEQIAANALTSSAHSCTYCLFDATTGANGTAVAVCIGPRYFLATAAHVIPESHEFRLVLRDSVDGICDFSARHVHPTIDVGLLELRSVDVPRLGNTFLPAERLQTHADQQTEYDVTVVGFPHELMRQVGELPLSADETLSLRMLSAFTFHSVALPVSEWPAIGTTRTPALGIDVFIDFDPEDSLSFTTARTAGDVPRQTNGQAPLPAGISGGGVWLLRSTQAGAIWHPAPLLHAIQFGFNPDGWLRAATIDSWLDVVDDNYPDLRPEISKIRGESTGQV